MGHSSVTQNEYGDLRTHGLAYRLICVIVYRNECNALAFLCESEKQGGNRVGSRFYKGYSDSGT